MKKIFAPLALMLIAAMLFAGCGKKVSLDYNYDLSEYVTVCEYKNVVIEITEKEVEEAIQDDIKSLGETKIVTDRGAAFGDTISITYSGRLEGETEPFENGTGSKTSYTFGKGGFIPGFEDAIVGHNLNEEFDINVTFPEDYQKADMAGKAAVFTIKITDLKETIYPELTDELVKKEFGFDTIEEYRQDVIASYNNYDNIWSYLTSKSLVNDFPEKELKYYKDYYYDSYKTYYSGVDFDVILSTYLGVTADQFEEYAEQYAEQMVLVEMIMYTIARNEGIVLTDEKYQEGLEEYAEYYQYTDLKQFEKDYGKESLVTALTMDEVTDFILKTSTVRVVESTETDGE